MRASRMALAPQKGQAADSRAKLARRLARPGVGPRPSRQQGRRQLTICLPYKVRCLAYGAEARKAVSYRAARMLYVRRSRRSKVVLADRWWSCRQTSLNLAATLFSQADTDNVLKIPPALLDPSKEKRAARHTSAHRFHAVSATGARREVNMKSARIAADASAPYFPDFRERHSPFGSLSPPSTNIHSGQSYTRTTSETHYAASSTVLRDSLL